MASKAQSRQKPLFAVFSDPSSDKHQQTATSTVISGSSSKRLKPSTTSTSNTRKININVDAGNKENIHPVSGKRAGLSKPVLGEKKGANISKTPSLPGKSSGLWAGKDPYGPSSPESQQVTCAKNKTIYDLPSVDAHAAKPAPMRAVARKTAGVASSSSFAGNRVNRPNKKIAVAVFRDPLPTLSSSSHQQAEAKGTPVSLSRASGNTLARRMTESPLAEVTQAYTGSGRFQASPVPILPRRLLSRACATSENSSMDSVLSLDSPNTDSGFGSSRSSSSAASYHDEVPISPLPPRSLSQQDLADLQRALSATSLQSASPKRRISQVSDSESFAPVDEHELQEQLDDDLYTPRNTLAEEASNPFLRKPSSSARKISSMRV